MAGPEFLGTPKVQYFSTSTQEFLSGGALYSYIPGTMTEKATYSSIEDADAETNANTNPVILDSRGEATVVLKGATKLILKDEEDGNVIWTVDSVGSGGADIVDSNNNDLLTFFEVSNAVNNIQIRNAVTGNSPIIEAVGDDTNVGIELKTKGTGRVKIDDSLFPASDGTNGNMLRTDGAGSMSWSVLVWPNTDSTAGKILQTNGSGTIQFTPFTMPTADGTANQLLATNGSGAVTFRDASTVAIPATPNEMETGTSNTLYTTPYNAKWERHTAKGWAKCNYAGVVTESFNVTSVTDAGTGRATINWTAAFSAGTYCAVATAQASAASTVSTGISATTTTQCSFYCNTTGGTAFDTDSFSVVAFGDN